MSSSDNFSFAVKLRCWLFSSMLSYTVTRILSKTVKKSSISSRFSRCSFGHIRRLVNRFMVRCHSPPNFLSNFSIARLYAFSEYPKSFAILRALPIKQLCKHSIFFTEMLALSTIDINSAFHDSYSILSSSEKVGSSTPFNLTACILGKSLPGKKSVLSALLIPVVNLLCGILVYFSGDLQNLQVFALHQGSQTRSPRDAILWPPT